MHGLDNKVGNERERVVNERKELGTQSPPVDSSFLYIFLYLFLSNGIPRERWYEAKSVLDSKRLIEIKPGDYVHRRTEEDD